MKVWVMQGSYEGELFSSVHLTQKGCALACIADVLDFHGVEDEETALTVMNTLNGYRETDGEQTEAFEWDQEKMKDMTSEQLWKIFQDLFHCDVFFANLLIFFHTIWGYVTSN